MTKKKYSQSENKLLVKCVFVVTSIILSFMLRPPDAKSGTGPRSNYTQPCVGTYATNGESSTQPCVGTYATNGESSTQPCFGTYAMNGESSTQPCFGTYAMNGESSTQPCFGTHATNGESSTQLSNNSEKGRLRFPSPSFLEKRNNLLEKDEVFMFKSKITKSKYVKYPIMMGYALPPGQEPAEDIIESMVVQPLNRGLGLNLNQRLEDPEEIAFINYQRELLSFQQNKEDLEKVMKKELTEAVILGFAIEDKKSMGTILHDGKHEGSPEQLHNLNFKLEEVKLILNYSEKDKCLKRKQNKIRNLEEMLRIGQIYLLDRKEGGTKQSPKKPQFLVTKEKRGSR